MLTQHIDIYRKTGFWKQMLKYSAEQKKQINNNVFCKMQKVILPLYLTAFSHCRLFFFYPSDHLRKNCIQIVSVALNTVGIFAVFIGPHCECNAQSLHAGLGQKKENTIFICMCRRVCVCIHAFRNLPPENGEKLYTVGLCEGGGRETNESKEETCCFDVKQRNKQADAERQRQSEIKRRTEINRIGDRYKGIALCEPAPGGFLTAWTMFLSFGLCVCVRV